MTSTSTINKYIYAEGVAAVEEVEVAGVLAGGEGGEGGEGGLTGGLTGRPDPTGRGGEGTASGLTGRPLGLTGAADSTGEIGALVEGGVALVGASEGTANGTATKGDIAPVGADDVAEVELLGNALPLSAAAAMGVAEVEGIEELVEVLLVEAALEIIDLSEGGILARVSERPLMADLSSVKSS